MPTFCAGSAAKRAPPVRHAWRIRMPWPRCGSNPAGPGGRPASGRAAITPPWAASIRHEVTGAIAMRAFVDELAAMMTRVPQFADDLQFLAGCQMLNPDPRWCAATGAPIAARWISIAIGGLSPQPETRSVKAWLDALPQGHTSGADGGFPFDSPATCSTCRRQGQRACSGAFGRHGWMAARRPLPAILSPSSRATPILAAARPRTGFTRPMRSRPIPTEVADDADVRQSAALPPRLAAGLHPQPLAPWGN